MLCSLAVRTVDWGKEELQGFASSCSETQDSSHGGSFFLGGIFQIFGGILQRGLSHQSSAAAAAAASASNNNKQSLVSVIEKESERGSEMGPTDGRTR